MSPRACTSEAVNGAPFSASAISSRAASVSASVRGTNGVSGSVLAMSDSTSPSNLAPSAIRMNSLSNGISIVAEVSFDDSIKCSSESTTLRLSPMPMTEGVPSSTNTSPSAFASILTSTSSFSPSSSFSLSSSSCARSDSFSLRLNSFSISNSSWIISFWNCRDSSFLFFISAVLTSLAEALCTITSFTTSSSIDEMEVCKDSS
mmetsp:Transcript_12622/g.20489  ORF Transcript_12622/g.20489 Transcript_12622/m.20489 type:complete len:204 (-) Transcript_12622:1309-1920(-)